MFSSVSRFQLDCETLRHEKNGLDMVLAGVMQKTCLQQISTELLGPNNFSVERVKVNQLR